MHRIITLLYILACFSTAASAEIYRWEDANGIHLTDNPSSVPEKYRKKVEGDVRYQPDNDSLKPTVGINKLNVPAITNQFQPTINQANLEQQRRSNEVLRQQQARAIAANNKTINDTFHSLARFMVIWIMIGCSLFIAWIFTVIDIVRSEFTSPSNKTVWILLVLLLPLLGMALYFLFGLSQKCNAGGHRNKHQEELLARLYPRDPKDKDFVI